MSNNKEDSPKELALKSIPTEWREKMIAEAATVGCKADDDVLWTVISSVINAWACAGAAGEAAQAVQGSVDKIPDRIFQGALKAGNDINSQFEKKFGEYGQTLIVAVDKARDDAKAQIRQGIVIAGGGAVKAIQDAGQSVQDSTKNLEQMLDNAIQAKAQQGVQEWANAAQQAGKAAAWAASQKIYSKASMVIGGALLLALFAGGGIVYFGAGLNDEIAPLPIKLVKGVPDCFVGSSGKGYCQLTGTAKQLSNL